MSVVHRGPFIPNCSHDTLLTLEVDGRSLTLNREQSLMLALFESKNKMVDDVFRRNFWKTLHPSIKRIPNTYSSKKVASTPCTLERNVEHFKYAIVNSNRVSLINYKTEYPHLFNGRGDHPLRGSCKYSIHASDVIINRFNDPGFRLLGYSKYVDKPEVNWTSCWKDPLTMQWKYVIMSDNNRLVQKFDLARKLHSKLSSIRAMNAQNAISNNIRTQQLALATFFIYSLGIRIGNEKDHSIESETVGCCSLRKHEHVTIQNKAKQTIHLSFLGKDSILFERTLKLPSVYWKIIESSFNDKKTKILFHVINPTSLNNYLNSLFPMATAKVFRTCIASSLFQKTLRDTNNMLLANKTVAEFCNHKRKSQSGYKLNLITSRSNYIDPRIYFAYIQLHPNMIRSGWFIEHKHWADRCPGYKF